VIDYTGRLFREGKALISAELSAILERLGTNAQRPSLRIEKLTKGRSAASSQQRASAYARSHAG
jgi:hypothetical protein